MPPVVAGSRLLMIRRHGQRPPRASQSLYLRLLVHREHYGVVGRVDIQAHDIADLELEPRVPGDLERLHLMRLEAVAAQNVANRCRFHAANLPGQRLESPVPGVLRRRRHREVDRRLHLVLLNRLLPRRAAWRPEEDRRRPPRESGPASATPSAFDIPVRRIVPIRPRPESSPGTMRARQACFRRLRGWPATRSRRLRSPSESPVSVLVDFLPICLSPVLLAARNGGGRTISHFRKKWNHLF